LNRCRIQAEPGFNDRTINIRHNEAPVRGEAKVAERESHVHGRHLVGEVQQPFA
jgi:hypothetical protein